MRLSIQLDSSMNKPALIFDGDEAKSHTYVSFFFVPLQVENSSCHKSPKYWVVPFPTPWTPWLIIWGPALTTYPSPGMILPIVFSGGFIFRLMNHPTLYGKLHQFSWTCPPNGLGCAYFVSLKQYIGFQNHQPSSSWYIRLLSTNLHWDVWLDSSPPWN